MTNAERLRQAFLRALPVDAAKVTDAFSFGSPGWDSVAHMALIASIENEFGIMMDTADVIAMSSVAKAKEIVAKYGIDINA